ncbi:succinate-semialdehyde dehydrogenase/glutarate-semialdehyde dehydrogenase [Pseudarthrobacter oxydans]|uniref:Succinate-semialdehyde dehydrogenase/glutarate-semialdehyde dehydrogenase n=1 Tax=Pseudarthrobacter oxydans TaxID=1671 RepID=A0AAW8NGY1_PSEOX|nr:NAD-dependent succinate-semialdehyde dehydrogenase [Pseudarthrobacter oxydans]MDR7165719.1 succinate-semialdehyde dehydrogenase/glutarate-semialdehyde dehydrogenase [Pseudarthrobacter oxydans]
MSDPRSHIDLLKERRRMGVYTTVNPATGEKVAEFSELTDEEATAALDQAGSAYTSWKQRALQERVAFVKRIAEVHREQREDLASLITLEMGKPITQARGEVDLVASIYDYYADHAEEFLADEPLDIAGPGTAVVKTEPVGVLVGIMPWNYPYYQVARFAAPNLILGNTILLKHARNCPQSALAIARVFSEAGLPEGVYTNLFSNNGQIADMIADPRVQGVSLTGSERAGSAVGEVAGRHMKKYVLELGGSDPFIVLDDADLDAAAAAAAVGRFSNVGQACTASKRFIVLDTVYDRFLEKFIEQSGTYVAGNPALESTKLGPLSSDSARQDFVDLVDDAIERGASVHLGGELPDSPGAFYPATVLSNVTKEMRAYTEELFGPAAVVHRAASEEDAISIANDSPFGLSGSVFSLDPERALRVANQIETGMMWINSTSKTAPDLPFGGIKASGVGRELARYGINEFANKKLIRIPHAEQ